MAISLSADQVVKALYDQHYNNIQIVLSLMARYNPHVLGLLAGAEFKDRVKRLSKVMSAYVDQILSVSLLKRHIVRVKIYWDECWTWKRIPLKADKDDPDKITGWRKVRNDVINIALEQTWEYCHNQSTEWLRKNEDVLKMAEAHFAIFRSISILEAYDKLEKKVAGALGLTGGSMDAALKTMRAENERRAQKEQGGIPNPADMFGSVPVTPTPATTPKLTEKMLSDKEKKALDELGLKVENITGEKQDGDGGS